MMMIAVLALMLLPTVSCWSALPRQLDQDPEQENTNKLNTWVYTSSRSDVPLRRSLLWGITQVDENTIRKSATFFKDRTIVACLILQSSYLNHIYQSNPSTKVNVP